MRFIIIALITLCAFAKKPTDFKVNSEYARFVDFSKAYYQIDYDLQSKSAKVRSEIYFSMEKEGKAIIDLKPNATSVRIDGMDTKLIEIASPDKITRYKLINSDLAKGEHKLVITNEINTNLAFRGGSVKSAFWMSDLEDRSYLEQYIPSNIEFDQYEIQFDVKIKGAKENHKIYTNGKLTEKGNNSFSIKYPNYFTVSSLYFHLTPTKKIQETNFSYKSISGKSFPVTIYKKKAFLSASLASLKSKTQDILKELESKFGAWPHTSLIIFKAPFIEEQGGMEYSGATITSVSALGHEITHSYFARGVMPVDGNSGWMDEAIASWRDDGYKTISSRSTTNTDMANKSEYKRTTDRRAYSLGAKFMGYLNDKLDSVGGLTAFLKELHKNYTHKSITTNTLIKELKNFSGINFQKDFELAVLAPKEFGANAKKGTHNHLSKDRSQKMVNPYHLKLTKEQLINLL